MKKLTRVALAFALVITMLPGGALTAFADIPQDVGADASLLEGGETPVVGEADEPNNDEVYLEEGESPGSEEGGLEETAPKQDEPDGALAVPLSGLEIVPFADSTVDSFAALQSAISGAGSSPTTITIRGDIPVTSSIGIPAGSNITLVSHSSGGSLTRGIANSPLVTVASGGKLTISGDLKLDGDGRSGELVRVLGECTLSGNAVITGSTTHGIYVGDSATPALFTMEGGEISGNHSTAGVNHGTGLYITTEATFVMNGGKVTNNSAAGSGSRGAGIYTDGSSYFNAGEVSYNTNATGFGGGMYIEVGSITHAKNILVTENQARTGGGLWTCNTGTNLLGYSLTNSYAVFGNTSTGSGNDVSHSGGGYPFYASTTCLGGGSIAWYDEFHQVILEPDGYQYVITSKNLTAIVDDDDRQRARDAATMVFKGNVATNNSGGAIACNGALFAGELDKVLSVRKAFGEDTDSAPVTVHLYKGDTYIESVVLDSSNSRFHTFTGLDADGYDQYRVVEDPIAGMEGSLKWEYDDGEYRYVTITNTQDTGSYGSLQIKKTVTGTSDSSLSFEFEIELGAGAADYPYTLRSSSSSKEGTLHVVDGKATLALKHNETVTIKNIPVGTAYKVTEPSDPRFQATLEGAGGSQGPDSSSWSGTIVEDTTPIGNWVTFTNAKTTCNFSAFKTVTGTADFAPSTFQFEIRDDSDAAVAYGTVTPSAANTPAPIKFYKESSRTTEITDWTLVFTSGKTYKLVETSGGADFDVSYSGGQGNDHNEFTPNFSDSSQVIEVTALNTKNAGFDFKAYKTVTGTADFQPGSFDFEVRGASGAVAWGRAEVASADAATPIDFFKDAGRTDPVTDWTEVLSGGQPYELVETGGGSGFALTYTGGDGALSNGFTPDFSGEAQSIAVTALNTRNTTFDFSATKTVEGSASFVARDFEFQVRDAAGDPVAYGRASVNAKGVATDVEFYEEPSYTTEIDDWTKVLVSGETYSLVEMNAGAYSVTYSGGSGALGNEFVADFAHDAAAIEFSVDNTLEAGFAFAGSKIVSGGANFTARDFAFELRDAQGDPVAYGTSSVNVKGQATDIDFFLDDAYTTEVTDWADVLVDGETYTLVETDQGAYTVTYTGGEGPDHNQFTADFAHDAAAIEFSVDNCLNYKGIDPTLTGFKVLEGRDLRDGEFTFTAEVVKGDPNEIVGNGYANGKISTTNKADGTITFPSLYIEHAGTYVFKIYEEKGSASGVFYTDAVFYASVTAHDIGGGILNEELTYWRTYDARTGTVSGQVNPKDVKFVNKYDTTIVKTGDDVGGAVAIVLLVAAGSGAALAASKLHRKRKAKHRA